MDPELTILTYAEPCTRAGQRRHVGHDEDADELATSMDYDAWTGTRDELRGYAESLRRQADAAGAGRDLYLRRVADVLDDAAARD